MERIRIETRNAFAASYLAEAGVGRGNDAQYVSRGVFRRKSSLASC